MTIRTRRVLFGLGLVCALALAVIGLSGGTSQISNARTTGQRIQTDTQFVYGALALLLPVAIVLRRWVRTIVVCWTIAATAAGAIAPVVWGGSSVVIGFVSGVAAAAVALGIAWLLRAGAARPADAIEPTT